MISCSLLSPARLNVAFRRMTIGAAVGAMALVPGAAQAQTWYGTLMGSNEVPPNASQATGFVTMTLNGNFLSLNLNWSGLTGGPASAGHIHCCVAPGANVGVAVGFTGLPNATSGSYANIFDLTNMGIYTNAFLMTLGGGTAAGAKAALVSGLNSGTAYVNLHNPAYPGGEIRANVAGDVTVTPEPASVAMLGLGLAGVGMAVRRKRRAR